MSAFAAVEDLRRHLNISTAVDDDEMQDMLDAAEEVVRDLIWATFDAGTVTEQVHGFGGTVLLSQRPVVGPVEVDGSVVPEDRIDRDAGVLYDVPRTRRRTALTVTYSTGSSAVPASVRLATLVIAAHLWETQRMPGQAVDSRPAGFGGVDGEPDAAPFAGFAIPNRAQELLTPWMRAAKIA